MDGDIILNKYSKNQKQQLQKSPPLRFSTVGYGFLSII